MILYRVEADEDEKWCDVKADAPWCVPRGGVRGRGIGGGDVGWCLWLLRNTQKGTDYMEFYGGSWGTLP